MSTRERREVLPMFIPAAASCSSRKEHPPPVRLQRTSPSAAITGARLLLGSKHGVGELNTAILRQPSHPPNTTTSSSAPPSFTPRRSSYNIKAWASQTCPEKYDDAPHTEIVVDFPNITSELCSCLTVLRLFLRLGTALAGHHLSVDWISKDSITVPAPACRRYSTG